MYIYIQKKLSARPTVYTKKVEKYNILTIPKVMKYYQFEDWKKEEQSRILEEWEQKQENNSMTNQHKNVACYGPIIGGVYKGELSSYGSGHHSPYSGVSWR